MRFIEHAGCRWPAPDEWLARSQLAVGSDEGLLQIVVDVDGELIDEERRDRAAAARPGAWRLVSTANGLTLRGLYAERGTTVLTYLCRVDREHLGGLDVYLGETQATYVFASNSDRQVCEIEKQIHQIEIDVDPLLVDDLGRALIGPLPIPSGWKQYEGESPRSSSWDAHHKLLTFAGSWASFRDEIGASGCDLLPLSWTHFDEQRVRDLLFPHANAVNAHDISVESSAAQVGDYRLNPSGISYRYDGGDRRRYIGAVWADCFSQTWHLKYYLTDHLALVR